MKKTILKAALISLVLAAPVAVLAAGGLVGECINCHTMHASEGGEDITGLTNLLRDDCMGCHASAPTGAENLVLGAPQVAHNNATDLAGGNFYNATYSAGKVHNVIDLFGGGPGNAIIGDGVYETNDQLELGAPPGNSLISEHGIGVFSSSASTAFDAFTCAGARGCHGTRSQSMEVDNDTGTAGFQGELRTGMQAINGAHHANVDGLKAGTDFTGDGEAHTGAKVAAGYRFIPGLKGYGNETQRWQNFSTSSHNEYQGDAATAVDADSCATCHLSTAPATLQMGLATNMLVPNNSMSGFCSTCHGNFHSAADNGSSGAFLRHPADYAIGATMATAYTAYSDTAPVARATVLASSTTDVNATDMVMCLSCHSAHGSDYEYILRYDYTAMIAGTGGTAGVGCLACHTDKD